MYGRNWISSYLLFMPHKVILKLDLALSAISCKSDDKKVNGDGEKTARKTGCITRQKPAEQTQRYIAGGKARRLLPELNFKPDGGK